MELEDENWRLCSTILVRFIRDTWHHIKHISIYLRITTASTGAWTLLGAPGLTTSNKKLLAGNLRFV